MTFLHCEIFIAEIRPKVILFLHLLLLQNTLLPALLLQGPILFTDHELKVKLDAGAPASERVEHVPEGFDLGREVHIAHIALAVLGVEK